MCDCASCSATASNKARWAAWLAGSGEVQQFKLNARDQLPPEHYPSEKLARMDSAYRAHVAHALRGGIARLIPPSAFANPGAGFYGVPAGSTRGQVAHVLARSFAPPRQFSPLARLAQQYRPQRSEA